MRKVNHVIYKILVVALFISSACSKEITEVEEIPIVKEDPKLPEADSKGYPFSLPADITASFDIDISSKVAANNLLLGFNFGGYSTTNEKEIVRYINPVGIRFPSGVWSNWYNWEKDISEYDPNDSYDIGDFHKKVMDDYAKYNLYTGFAGMKTMHDELKFNVLFTYNVNYDSNEKSVARLNDRVSKGFDVNYIELGNEQFWKDQRSGRIATPELYYPVAKSLSAALKVANSNVKISVPLSWRTSHDAYNAAIAKSTDYFDAITLHKYVHYQKDDAVKSKETYASILTSRFELEESKNFVRIHAPGKPIWLTEWGVSCGLNAASFIGQADAYLYLFENQIYFERAEWYGATTELNPLYYFSEQYLDNRGKPEKSLRNIRKTGHGAVFEIIRSVFENSELLSGTIKSIDLVPNSKAVEAKAVLKNGKIEIIVINKTFKSIPLNIAFNGAKKETSSTHEALTFNSLDDTKTFNSTQNPLALIKQGTGSVILPPYSINKISEIK